MRNEEDAKIERIVRKRKTKKTKNYTPENFLGRTKNVAGVDSSFIHRLPSGKKTLFIS